MKKKQMKQTAKNNWIRFVLRLYQLKLNICSSTYDMKISSFILYWKGSRASSTVVWFDSRPTLRDSRVVHTARRLFWAWSPKVGNIWKVTGLCNFMKLFLTRKHNTLVSWCFIRFTRKKYLKPRVTKKNPQVLGFIKKRF